VRKVKASDKERPLLAEDMWQLPDLQEDMRTQQIGGQRFAKGVTAKPKKKKENLRIQLPQGGIGAKWDAERKK